jgi:hypothetical protein
MDNSGKMELHRIFKGMDNTEELARRIDNYDREEILKIINEK